MAKPYESEAAYCRAVARLVLMDDNRDYESTFVEVTEEQISKDGLTALLKIIKTRFSYSMRLLRHDYHFFRKRYLTELAREAMENQEALATCDPAIAWACVNYPSPRPGSLVYWLHNDQPVLGRFEVRNEQIVFLPVCTPCTIIGWVEAANGIGQRVAIMRADGDPAIIELKVRNIGYEIVSVLRSAGVGVFENQGSFRHLLVAFSMWGGPHCGDVAPLPKIGEFRHA